MGVDAMMTSQVLRALESHALVTRNRDTTDTRVVNVEATLTGQRRVNTAIGEVEAIDREFFGSLGHDQAAFVNHLSKLLPGHVDER